MNQFCSIATKSLCMYNQGGVVVRAGGKKSSTLLYSHTCQTEPAPAVSYHYIAITITSSKTRGSEIP